MIPKIIHFCWLSKNPYPAGIKRCMDSWKRHLPDYEFIHWNFDRFPRGKSKWVDQAFDAGKYAFAADYIRLYALYNYGGIYLDTDVEVVKPFGALLHLPYFIGKEDSQAEIAADTLGFEKGNSLMLDMLKSYEGQEFVNSDGSFNMEPLPCRIRRCIDERYHYNLIDKIEEFNCDSRVVNVFPVDWFRPMRFETHELHMTNNTYSIHRFAASWWTPREWWVRWANEHFGYVGAGCVRFFWRPFPDIIKSFPSTILRVGRRAFGS